MAENHKYFLLAQATCPSGLGQEVIQGYKLSSYCLKRHQQEFGMFSQ